MATASPTQDATTATRTVLEAIKTRTSAKGAEFIGKLYAEYVAPLI